MNLPSMVSKAKSRDNQTMFLGYNHNLVNGENEFYDMKNMTGDYCPVLSPRARRARLAVDLKNPQGLIAKGALAWVDDGKFYYRKREIGAMNTDYKGDRQLISMGAYIVIFPDKYRYNTSNGEFISLEHEWKASGDVITQICTVDGDEITTEDDRLITEKPEEPENGDWWIDQSGESDVLKCYSEATEEWVSVATTYVKLFADGIGAGFEKLDAVEISEAIEKAGIDKGSYPIWSKGDDYIVITALVKGSATITYDENNPLTVARKVPDLDYVVESENRLWGCRWDGEINEICASAQGDATNWNKFLGTTQDSYRLSVGSDGVFTGAAVQQGYVMFFKENVIHKIYGSKPTNYQITNVTGRGIMQGSSKSAVIVNETLYYLSKNGVCQYGGGTPISIYAPFGRERYSKAAGGKAGDKYYISMKNRKGKYNLFCFDETLNMWFKEDDTQVKFFAEDKGNLYFINDKNELWVIDGEEYDEEYAECADREPSFEWFAETGDIGIQQPDCKIYSNIQIRLNMSPGARVSIFAQYDSDGEWIEQAALKDKPKGAYTVSFSTPKVDHFKLKICGRGEAKIYSISKWYEDCSEVRGNNGY